jgi:hypothetical protein
MDIQEITIKLNVLTDDIFRLANIVSYHDLVIKEVEKKFGLTMEELLKKEEEKNND